MITHVVMFKLKDHGAENVNKTKNVLLGLEGKIPQLLYIEVGTDVLHSERSFDLVLITKFNSLEDLQAYQVHPIHQEVITYIKSVAETTIAVDYES